MTFPNYSFVHQVVDTNNGKLLHTVFTTHVRIRRHNKWYLIPVISYNSQMIPPIPQLEEKEIHEQLQIILQHKIQNCYLILLFHKLTDLDKQLHLDPDQTSERDIYQELI